MVGEERKADLEATRINKFPLPAPLYSPARFTKSVAYPAQRVGTPLRAYIEKTAQRHMQLPNHCAPDSTGVRNVSRGTFRCRFETIITFPWANRNRKA